MADVSEFNGGEYGACMKYTLLGEDHQMRSCVLGSAADKMLASQHLSIGDYIRITFKGVKALDGGKRVNLFEILRDEQEPKEKK